MEKIELNDFVFDGFGWICRHCERELSESRKDIKTVSRLFYEGEAEERDPVLSNQALAKWADPEQRTLICPRCGITEIADKH